MILQKFKQKFSTLSKVLRFIYSRYTIAAILRDILFIIFTAAEIYGITILGRFIDETTNILLNWDQFDLTTYLGTKSFLFLAFLLGLWIVRQFCSQTRSYLYQIIYENMWEDTQHMILKKVAKANLEDVEKEEFQDLLTFVPSFSIPQITSVYENFSAVISNIVRLISAAVILFATMNWTIIFLVLMVVPEVIATHIRRRQVRKYRDEEVGKNKYLNYLQNVGLQISNFSELRVNDVYKYINRRFREEYDEYIKGYLEKQYSFIQDKITYSIFSQVLKYIYIIYVLSVSILKGLSFGTFKALFDYVDVIHTSIFRILNSLSLMSNNLGYAGEFFLLSEYEGFGDLEHGSEKLKGKTPKIEINNLSFAYPDDPRVKILKNIDVEIKPGEKVAFFGGDGSGKSTMVKILTGLYRVKKGEYLLDGHNVWDLDRGELKKKLSVTFQDFIDYHFSLEENIVISGQRKSVDRFLLKKVSKVAGVTQFKKDIKLTNKSILGKTFPSGKDLSPGYWQRLAIARMLYRNRKIFLLDEPFTYIDDISAREILKNMLKFVGKDRSVIYITRSTKHLKNFDKIYYFEKGKVVESGSWKDLMKQKGRLYKETKNS